MTDTLIPYSFIPGTKAKAQEVNANFIALANSITENNTTLNSNKLNKDLSNVTQAGIEVIKNNSAPPRNIGEIVTSTIPLSDAGLHLLDGALISGSGTYSAFVDYIAGLATYYPNLFETEANWQSSVTTCGVCGKFVYDSTANTVRLPKITGIVGGTTDTTALGDLIQAGLPNITGWIGGGCLLNDEYKQTPEGALSFDESRRFSGPSIQGDYFGPSLSFNAHNSNSLYGNSSTVQPQTIKVLYYIVIANTTKTDVVVDIDEIATDLNGKTDVDLTNVNNSGTSRGASWAMPTGTNNVLTLGASGTTYTAPATGWFIIYVTYSSGTNGYIDLYTNTSGLGHRHNFNSSWNDCRTFVPAKKGTVLTVLYSGTFSYVDFRFIYAQGSESEAN